jgi:hypothetical protein
VAAFLGVILHQLIEAIKLQAWAFCKPLGRPTSYRSLLESLYRHNRCYICCFPCHLLALPCAKSCVKRGRNGRAMLPHEKKRISLIDTILMYGPSATHFHTNACNRFQSRNWSAIDDLDPRCQTVFTHRARPKHPVVVRMIDCTKEMGRKASIFIRIGQVQPIGHFTGGGGFPDPRGRPLNLVCVNQSINQSLHVYPPYKVSNWGSIRESK